MNSEFVLSIGFPQYIREKSGVSKVIMGHQQMFNKQNISYVHLFAVKKLLLHDRVTLFSYFGMYIDGKYEGIYTAYQILDRLNAWFGSNYKLLDIHLHHLLYLNLNNINIIFSALPNIPIKVYLHDYYLACTNYNLMKNNDVFCGGKGLGGEPCKGCASLKKSKREEGRIHGLLAHYSDRITFIAPSNVTKDIFLNFHSEYAAQTVVIPHQKYDRRYKGNLNPIPQMGKIRVAYIAMPKKHKGWETWERLVKKCASYHEYAFTVFNSSDDHYETMEKIRVSFSPDNLNAMTEIMRTYKVHLVLLWSLCAETYSYACYEAYAANAFIITNKDSGNIADTVRQNKIGLVLESEEELLDLFSKPERLRKLINDYRNSSEGGPFELYENDAIVQLSKNRAPFSLTLKTKIKIANYPLIAILNHLYKVGKI